VRVDEVKDAVTGQSSDREPQVQFESEDRDEQERADDDGFRQQRRRRPAHDGKQAVVGGDHDREDWFDDRRALLFHDLQELGLDGKLLEHADVGAAGIARRNRSENRADGTKHDARSLPDDCGGITTMNRNSQHQPVR
jgi:hypothetical protein